MNQPRKTGLIVAPGDRLGVIEEFIPGRGTYVDEGVIYAQTTGHALVDRENKRISVFQRSRIPITPRKGHTVFAQVQRVQEKLATLKILKDGECEFKKPFSAILYVAFVLPPRQYLESIKDAFRPGDMISAEVIGDKNKPYQLSTGKRELGVFQSYCSTCGSLLVLCRNRLMCEKCGKTERRKISENYGQEILH